MLSASAAIYGVPVRSSGVLVHAHKMSRFIYMLPNRTIALQHVGSRCIVDRPLIRIPLMVPALRASATPRKVCSCGVQQSIAYIFLHTHPTSSAKVIADTLLDSLYSSTPPTELILSIVSFSQRCCGLCLNCGFDSAAETVRLTRRVKAY